MPKQNFNSGSGAAGPHRQGEKGGKEGCDLAVGGVGELPDGYEGVAAEVVGGVVAGKDGVEEWGVGGRTAGLVGAVLLHGRTYRGQGEL